MIEYGNGSRKSCLRSDLGSRGLLAIGEGDLHIIYSVPWDCV